MKKNNMMRLASVLLVLVLLTTCAISGTFAKYVTTASSSDWARVAYWGFQRTNSIELTDLFKNVYNGSGDTSVDSVNDVDVIAPGTTGFDTFAFAWDEVTTAPTAHGAAATSLAVTGPEVAYEFKVEVDSNIDQALVDNTNIQWKLDDGTWGTFEAMVNAIKNLSGSTDNSGVKNYAPNTLPAEFTKDDDVHTIAWQWIFETDADAGADGVQADPAQDTLDTNLGNADELNDVYIKVSITATQLDTYTP